MPATLDGCRVCGAPPPLGSYGLCASCLGNFGKPFFSGPRALTAMAAGAPLAAAVLLYLGIDDVWALIGGALGAMALVFVGGILVELWRLSRLTARRSRP